MEIQADNNIAFEHNDCIYVVMQEDPNSVNCKSFTDKNFSEFFTIEDNPIDSQIKCIIKDDKEDSIEGAIVFEVSEDDICDNPADSAATREEDAQSCKYKQYVCAQCQSSFSRQYSLKVHMRTHTGEKPYKCTFDCPKSFATSGDLQRHVRIHTGDRPYKCTFDGCDLTFTTKANLGIHFRKHSGERPYSCEIEGCGKSFMQLTNFKNHQRTHTGEKPYQCEECKKCFSEYATLYKHRVSHKRVVKLYSCPVCNSNYYKDNALVKHVAKCHPDFGAFDINLAQVFLNQNK